MPKKTALRHTLLAQRHAIASDLRRQWDTNIGNQVVTWCQTHPVSSLGVYWPIRGEPDLRPIFPDLIALGMTLALPVVVAKNAALSFVTWSPGDALMKDAMGVASPAATGTTVQPDALLIPCVGFSHTRVRLGYGGGFYDRTLATSPRPFAIGIAYAHGLAAFDADPHDIGLDMIITEATAPKPTN